MTADEERIVEEVARALWEADHDRTAWEDATEDGPDEYRRRARAAVTAYRATQDGGAEEAVASQAAEMTDGVLELPSVQKMLAEVRRGRALREAVKGLASDYDANGNGCPLGDPSGNAWHKAARQLRAALAATDGTP